MAQNTVVNELTSLLGKQNILIDPSKTERYRKGFRSGGGDVVAVLFPTTLLMQWQVLKLCVKNDFIVIMQAANTGLTEGSTPNGNEYDREVVIVNTTKMTKIHLIDDGKQIISFPGATLYKLEKMLAKVNRQAHSVIGSSCIGASIVGGVCNNSGGALVQRGPAYTELALFAQITADGELQLVNHLGIKLGNSPEEILTRLEMGDFDISDFTETHKCASDASYDERVRDIEASTPARFNAAKRSLHEVSGCAGKLAVFAVRLDSFEMNKYEQVFYIGTNDPDELTEIRRNILTSFKNLPVLAEYMHEEIYDISKKYGKDIFVIINLLGTDYLPLFFKLKNNLDAWFSKIPCASQYFTDKLMQFGSRFLPNLLPNSIEKYRKKYKHYLILKMADDGIVEANDFLQSFYSSEQSRSGDYFKCSDKDANKILLHRFVAAGSAVRYHAVHHKQVEEVLALDVALTRNDRQWFETLPAEIEENICHKLYYGHFMCHVFHQDYLLKKGADVKKIKAEMLEIFDQKNAEYPAEHNVGHLYQAKPDLASFYRELDPTNSFNPGIGKMSKIKNYF